MSYRGVKIGLHGTIRTCSLLVPNKAVYQVDITQRLKEIVQGPNSSGESIDYKSGAPRQNRTAITGLQNQCTTIVLVGRNLAPRPGLEPGTN